MTRIAEIGEAVLTIFASIEQVHFTRDAEVAAVATVVAKVAGFSDDETCQLFDWLNI